MAMARSTPTEEITDIQRRMAQIRHELHAEVREAVKGAQSLTDWRSQVRNHPWLALGAAAAVGYLAVPKRQSPPPSTIVTLGHPPAATAPAAAVTVPAQERKARRWGLLGSAFGMLAPIAVRAAQNYAIQYLEQWIAAQPPAGRPSPFHPGPSPGAPRSDGGSATGGRPPAGSRNPGPPGGPR